MIYYIIKVYKLIILMIINIIMIMHKKSLKINFLEINKNYLLIQKQFNLSFSNISPQIRDKFQLKKGLIYFKNSPITSFKVIIIIAQVIK